MRHREHVKVAIVNGRLEPVVKFRTWYGGEIKAVRCASFSPKRGTYSKNNQIRRAAV